MSHINDVLKAINRIKDDEHYLSKEDVLSILEATKSITKHHEIINSLILFFSTLHPNINSSYKLLTNREKEVLNLVGLGHKNSTIANILDLSISTIETHRKNMRRKIKLTGKGKLLEYAILNNLQLHINATQ